LTLLPTSRIPPAAATSGETRQPVPGRERIRVAVLCDFLEERWPSMDLAGDMLCRRLADDQAGEVAVTQLRPHFRRRLTHLPLLGEQASWNADRLLNRFLDYPLWLRLRQRRGDYDLFHLVDHSYSQLLHGLPSKRTVVTCHDLDTFRCLLEPHRESRPPWFRAMAKRILSGFQRAAHVITVSMATREELLRHRLFPQERISVIPNGTHPSCSPLPDPSADAIAARLLSGDPSDRVWLLNVGSTLPRKRLDVLLRVFAAVRQAVPKALLVRAGGGFTAEQLQLAAELNLQDAILILPFLERETLAAVYRRATLLLHTAEAEGFGLPLIEAMACGCPVLASDIPVLREVGGSAATYSPLGNVDAWKDSVVRLLQKNLRDHSASELGRQQARAHAARFSWAENAGRTAHIYRSVLDAARARAGPLDRTLAAHKPLEQ
jgi:glycosyltransferase involved in cell wall biosynthesis